MLYKCISHVFMYISNHCLYLLSITGCRGAGVNPSWLQLRHGVHPGQVYRRANTAFTPVKNLDYSLDLICVPLGCGRTPGHQEETHTGTERTCKLPNSNMQKIPSWQLWHNRPNHRTTALPLYFHSLFNYLLKFVS